jgi:hypothetical protein
MFRIDNPTSVPHASGFPTPGAVGPNPNGWFRTGSPSGPVSSTVVDADWLNSVQEELGTVIAAAPPVVLSKSSQRNLLDAINYLISHYSALVAGGTANAQTVTLSPAPTSMTTLVGVPLYIKSVGTNTGAVTLNVNALGAHAIVQTSGGSPLSAGALAAGYYYTVIWDGASFQLVSLTDTFTDPSAAGLTINGTGAQGANLALLGSGGTTPNKFIRAVTGFFDVVNSAYSAVIMRLSDAGDLTQIRNLTTSGAIAAGTSVTAENGNVLAQNGRLRASFGAFGSGDLNAGSILNDFTIGSNANGTWMRFPNGWQIMIGTETVPIDNTQHLFTLPNSFSTTGWSIAGQQGAFTPVPAGLGIQPATSSVSQFWMIIPSAAGGSVGCWWLATGF